MKTLIILIVITIMLYLIFHSQECAKYSVLEPFQQIPQFISGAGQLVGQAIAVTGDPNMTGWVYVGDIYSQKAGKTGKLMLEKNHNPLLPNVHKYRGVDVARKLFIPIDTNNREIRDGQLISIQGYEDSNPFLVELAKSMKYQYNLASY
jgi:hypothetical protein